MSLLQLLAIVVSALLLLVVLELVRRRKLTEEYASIWLVCSVALLVLSLHREILDTMARRLGVFYPPAVLLMVLTVFTFVACLYFSVVVSRQRAQIERLIEEVAILAAQQRELARRTAADRESDPASRTI